MTGVWDGGCLCGQVRFRAAGAPAWVGWCHCASCRRHTGAPVSVFAAFEGACVEVTAGEITRFESSPGVKRGFCARCGSTLTCEGPARPGEWHIHVGAFDRPQDLAPTFHLFAGERLPWVADPG
jgi:hypothetical protein